MFWNKIDYKKNSFVVVLYLFVILVLLNQRKVITLSCQLQASCKKKKINTSTNNL